MHGDKRNRTIFVFNLLVSHALSQLRLFYCSRLSFPVSVHWRASLSAFAFFGALVLPTALLLPPTYIGNRSNQRWISQERWVRRSAPISAASFLEEDATAPRESFVGSAPLGTRFGN